VREVEVQRRTTFHRTALVTAVATFFLLLVGGVVHGTGSSLACPDWPLCYGEVFPKMVGGVFYEHSHRLFAAGIGLATVALCVMAVRGRREDRTLGWLGPIALTMVVLQGVLGGLTVIFKLPTAVSTAHLSLSMIFFCTMIYLAHRTRPGATTTSVATALPVPVRRLLIVTLGAVYLQVVLGGLVRHTGGGMACLDTFPLCQNKVWAGLHPTAQVQMAHRIFAAIVSLLVLVTSVRVWRAAAPGSRAHRLAALLPFVLAVQVLLGILSVWSMLGLWQVTAHLGGGALLLATTWLTLLSTRPVAVLRRREAHAAALVEAHS
jgi:heme A synthase